MVFQKTGEFEWEGVLMKAIEMETVISSDGKLPATFREVFGRKVRVIVLFGEEELGEEQAESDAERLMTLAGKVNAFRDVADPVAFQRELRDEWERGMNDIRMFSDRHQYFYSFV